MAKLQEQSQWRPGGGEIGHNKVPRQPWQGAGLLLSIKEAADFKRKSNAV